MKTWKLKYKDYTWAIAKRNISNCIYHNCAFIKQLAALFIMIMIMIIITIIVTTIIIIILVIIYYYEDRIQGTLKTI